MPSFDSIVVGEDWISEHYFTTDSVKESFHGKVMELRKAWDAEAKEGRATVRSSLLAAARDLQTGLASLAENSEAASKVHAGVRAAFGHDGELADFTAERAGAELRIPSAQLAGTTDVLFLQANPADSLEALLDPATGHLITPATEDGKPLESVSKAVSAAFRSDTPPVFIVVQAGQWHLLAEAERWAEGRYLAVDLLVVTERRHEARGGEIDRTAAIFGHQALKPDADGTIWWTGVLEDSVKHTVGVSKDLREGIRLSIEIIANEVVRRRPSMDGVDGNELAKQSLRFLYRILFLLYAEASPEMQVLPTGAAEYEEGYGLDRLRELTLTELVSHRARTGTHLYESLKKLFDLVEEGHTPDVRDDDSFPALHFNPLRADLFLPKATALIDDVKLGNEATQAVLEHLLLSKESKGRKGADRGFISYAELGINQLGAVYEGLMSYTGFFAEEDLYEVAKDGNPEKGSWVVPVDRADHLSESDFVRREDPGTHEMRPVVHQKGTFVFRLAGRERQQSASYYTPEVLTKFVISQALEELLDQNGHRTTPEEILQLTICEPALGSGAFAIEAVRQLAGEYLKRKQEDLGELIEADKYPVELQKVKAHIALQQVYGVDLNATAVELAEISLWLDTMVAGLQAPWFGLHLRRGNSLIGARRAVYLPGQLAKKAWLKAVPRDVPLGEEIGAGIHHFLLPAEGWGAVVDTAEAKTYAPEKREELRLWRNEIRKPPSKDIAKRLVGLAVRVETLWELTLRRLTIAEFAIRRDLHLWGGEAIEPAPAVTREQIESVLYNEDGAYRRLRRAMDAWCALWSWPVTEEIDAPDWDQWVGGLEAVLGTPPKAGRFEKHGQLSIASDLSWHELDTAEDTDRAFARSLPITKAIDIFPWLQVAATISKAQGYHHWELDFAAAFAEGGFDLQVGNPPWVQPEWSDKSILADSDPWWMLQLKAKESEKNSKREKLLEQETARSFYLRERAIQSGEARHLGSAVDHPFLAGLKPDTYRCFMTCTWRTMSQNGIVALIHPESHFTEGRAKVLRKESYRRLRQHWQFKNELSLFEIDHHNVFGVHIYGRSQAVVKFLHASSLFHPETATRSLKHDGLGLAPGIKNENNRWDLTPHSHRIISITENQLATWTLLVDDPETPPIESRMIYPVNSDSSQVLDKIAAAPRLPAGALCWTRGWEEDKAREMGFFQQLSGRPDRWRDVILQGPHLTVGNPLFKQPNATLRNNLDTSEIDLQSIAPDFIPSTRYQPSVPYPSFETGYTHWGDSPTSKHFRVAWREMAQPGNVRTLHSAIIPPGPTHVNAVQSFTILGDMRKMATLAGVSHSVVADFLIKVIGSAHIKSSTWYQIPFPIDHLLVPNLLLRTLRLNCLIAPYAPLWQELFEPRWTSDSWAPGLTPEGPLNELGDIERMWTPRTPLRTAYERRRALIEIDTIVAVMLGISVDELITIYRTQFPVLQRYEREARYDANGRQLPNKVASEMRNDPTLGRTDINIDGVTYAAPFNSVDRERDMILAHRHFETLTVDGYHDS